MNAIILHGRARYNEYYSDEYPSGSNSHWLPWLQKQLLIRGIEAQTPEVPLSYEPDWQRWVREVERFEITPQTLLVGHSLGGGFWVRYLSEHPELQVGRTVLVAPWIDVAQEDPSKFFDFELDPHMADRTQGLTIFHSKEDAPDIQSSVIELRTKLKNITYKEFEGRGHFTHHYMPSDTFPELLATLTDREPQGQERQKERKV